MAAPIFDAGILDDALFGGTAESLHDDLVFDDAIFDVGVPATIMQAWNGSDWVQGMLKRWNGSAWVGAVVQRWNGSAWVAA